MATVSFDFTGKRALVTGAGRGIGKAICIALEKAGAQTFVVSKTKENLDALVSEYPSIRPVCVDLSNWKETRKAMEGIGPIDLLVNNAVVVNRHPFLDVSEDAIDQQLDVNVKAVINVTQVVARGMIERKYPGSIVNISSVASLRAVQNHTDYCLSKAALDSLTRNMALELGPYQIRVNAVNPTVVLTESAEILWSNEVVARPLREKTPLGRFSVLPKNSKTINTCMLNPVVHALCPEAACIVCTRYTQYLDRNDMPHSLKTEETRIWHLKDDRWVNVHFHHS